MKTIKTKKNKFGDFAIKRKEIDNPINFTIRLGLFYLG